jgi:hypothetical protein
MCSIKVMFVGVSSEPAVIAVLSSPVGLQNKLLPQTPQNPRSAASDDRYQLKPSEAVKVRFEDSALVMAAWWPLVRRHCSQWQAIAPRSAPRI